MQGDKGDLIGGAALAVTGLAAAAWTGARLDFGSLARMGPGFFPVVLGLALAVLGLVIALPALRRPGRSIPLHLREAAAIIGTIALFAAGLTRLGLLSTTALSVLLATWPAPHAGIGWRIALALALTALTWVIFILGLRMSLPLWPTGFGA